METQPTPTLGELAHRIDTIEEAYEFMLAYAAQGRTNESGAPEPGIRAFLERLDTALGGVADAAARAARPSETETFSTFIDILAQDAKKARAIIRLVLARQSVSSQIIDNVNASIHIRALLADLFLIDELLNGEHPAA